MTAPADADRRTDHQLVSAAQRGSYEAFEALVYRYRDRVYRLALGVTKSPIEAEDVVQEAFLSLFRGLDSFRGESNVGTWIYRIATNAALMRMRTKRRKPLLSLESPPGPALGRSLWPLGTWYRQPDEQILDSELRGLLEDAINGLPDKYLLVLIMRDVEGFSNAEVAEMLGVTIPTVKARLHRARLIVRNTVAQYFGKPARGRGKKRTGATEDS